MSNSVNNANKIIHARTARGVRLLLALIVALTVASLCCVVVLAETTQLGSPSTGDSGLYSATIGDYQVTVDKANLNFCVNNGSTVWHSGNKYSQEDGLNASWSAMLSDAFTIGYVANNNAVSQKAMSQLGAVVSFEPKTNGFDAHIDCKVSNGKKTMLTVGFDMQWVLVGDTVSITILGDSIEEYSDHGYSLMHIVVYPFFNASYGVSEGYIFVPDGSGAVIDTSIPTVAKKAYSQRVYGDDIAVAGSVIGSTSPMSVYMGVYGLVNSDSSALVTIDQGAEYAEINAMVSGITTRYNIAYTKYILRQLYTNYVGSKGSDGDSYMDKQVDRNVYDIQQSYHLLAGNSTIGQLSQRYQSHLVSNNMLVKQDLVQQTSLRLLFLVYESRANMLGSTKIEMTNFDYIADIIEQYSGQDIVVSVMGIDKDGMIGSYPFDGEGISNSVARQLERLSALADSCGVHFAVNADFTLANDDSNIVGVRDRSMSIANQYVYSGNRLDRSLYNRQYYLLTADSANHLMAESARELADVGVNLMEINTYGWMLHSSYDNQQFSRSDMMDSHKHSLSTMSRVALDSANDYLWQYASYMYNMPTDSSQFVIETSSVPFLQMVLSGYMDLYSMPINLDYKGYTDILRSIEYNTFMSYVLTQNNSIQLYGTESQYIFSSEYVLWEDNIARFQEDISKCLDEVRGYYFVEYYQPQLGISVSQYSNGVDIVVNYTNSSYAHNGTTVPANSAMAVE